MEKIPYYAQFESRDRVLDLIAGKLPYADDPLWQRSGATDPEEYAQWSSHICGMACLKMHLAHWQKRNIPTMELMRQCRAYGGYVVGEDGSIKGLIYRPFITFIAEEYGLSAELREHTPIEEIYGLLDRGYVFIASVHPGIRTPEKEPPKQGGHLVYVFGKNSERREIVFHNPSGHTPATQEAVRLDLDTFSKFYAQRGILIKT